MRGYGHRKKFTDIGETIFFICLPNCYICNNYCISPHKNNKRYDFFIRICKIILALYIVVTGRRGFIPHVQAGMVLGHAPATVDLFCQRHEVDVIPL